MFAREATKKYFIDRERWAGFHRQTRDSKFNLISFAHVSSFPAQPTIMWHNLIFPLTAKFFSFSAYSIHLPVAHYRRAPAIFIRFFIRRLFISASRLNQMRFEWTINLMLRNSHFDTLCRRPEAQSEYSTDPDVCGRGRGVDVVIIVNTRRKNHVSTKLYVSDSTRKSCETLAKWRGDFLP